MTAETTSRTRVDLPGGGHLPLLGFGTWQLRGSGARRAVSYALEAGYRHVDTASMYGNEREVGVALTASGIPRDELFVTTKLPPDRTGREGRTLGESMDALGVDYLDLWLVHWPPNDSAGVPTWRAFASAQEQGLVRDIGVSNYSLEQIDELVAETGVTPAVNQVRWSPSLFDRDLLAGMRERGVVLEGYSPFRAGGLADPAVTGPAERHGVTPAQVVVRWHLQHGVVVIPKSGRQERIVANADVDGFGLSDEEMAGLDALGVSSG